MQKSQSSAPMGGFGVQDVLFVLFKHKWKIIVFSLMGFAAAAVVYIKQEPIYRSKAKLLVRYVRETGTVDLYEDMKSPGGGGKAGDSVINTEIEIFNSLDLAMQVAETVGIGQLLPGAGTDGAATLSDAAAVILKGLEVMPGQSSNVLYVTYGSTDPELAQTVLKELVERYFEKHLEVHRSAAAFETVAKQTEEVYARLNLTDQQLNKLRTDSGILSLTDATNALSSQRSRTQEELVKAKADFAELQANIKARGNVTDAQDGLSAGDRTGHTKPTNDTQTAKETRNPSPPEAITEYRAIVELLAFLQKRNLELHIKFKSGNRLLALNQQQIETYDAKRRALINKYPDLSAEADVLEKDPQTPGSLIMEKARLAAISAKIEVFDQHLQEISKQFSQQYAIGAQIEALDRRKQMEEAEYRSLEVNLKNAKINQTLDPNRMPNITLVQQPSAPVKTFDNKTKKIILGLAGGGVSFGIGLAFLIDLILASKVKRPIEIQTRLQLPLLMSIPYIRKKERGGWLLVQDPAQPRIAMEEVPAIPGDDCEQGAIETSSKKASHFILPYSEAIRDRIIFNFEVNHVTHQPKLVAVTGLSDGAGASTIAAGLAKSFAEIRGMKVLLVDLSACHADESPLFGEIPRHSLTGALRLAQHTQFRDNPQSLYYASATARRDDSGLTSFSPVNLYELMPHLQASEYNYIIFDMPPIDQTSPTLTMAGMMDKVVLVLDAENTSRDGLVWGYAELVKGKADVSCVFNKTRMHVPGWLIGRN